MDENGDLRLTIEAARKNENWLMRCYGYELAREFFTITEPTSYEMYSYSDFIPEFLNEKNERCLTASLDAVKVFINRCLDAPLAQKITRMIIRNLLSNPSTKVQELSSQILLDLVELGKYDMVLKELISGALKYDVTTRNSCIRTMRYALNDFGPQVISARILLRFVDSLVKKSLFSGVQEECCKLLIIMYRYNGPHIRVHLFPLLRPEILSFIEDSYERVKHLHLYFNRCVRSIKGNSETLEASEEELFAKCKIVRDESPHPTSPEDDCEGMVSDDEDAIAFDTRELYFTNELEAESNGEMCTACGYLDSESTLLYDSRLPYHHIGLQTGGDDQKTEISYESNPSSMCTSWSYYRPVYLFDTVALEERREVDFVSSDSGIEPHLDIREEELASQKDRSSGTNIDLTNSNESHSISDDISQNPIKNESSNTVKQLELGLMQKELKYFSSDTFMKNSYRWKDKNIREGWNGLSASCPEINRKHHRTSSSSHHDLILLSTEERMSLKNPIVKLERSKCQINKQSCDYGNKKLTEKSSLGYHRTQKAKSQFKSKINNFCRGYIRNIRSLSFKTKNVEQSPEKKTFSTKFFRRCFYKQKKSDSDFVNTCSDFNEIDSSKDCSLLKTIEGAILKILSENTNTDLNHLERQTNTVKSNNAGRSQPTPNTERRGNLEQAVTFSNQDPLNIFVPGDTTESESVDLSPSSDFPAGGSEAYESSSVETVCFSESESITEVRPSFCCYYFQRNSINRLMSNAELQSQLDLEDHGYNVTDGHSSKGRIDLSKLQTGKLQKITPGVSCHRRALKDCIASDRHGGSGDPMSSSSWHRMQQRATKLHPQGWGGKSGGKMQKLFCCISMGDVSDEEYQF